MFNVKISVGNSKLGNIPSVSLPAVKTCADNVPCAKKCYAVRMEKRFSAVKASYENNLCAYLENPAQYFRDIEKYIAAKNPLAFRWHVSGDIPNMEYLLGMIKIAEKFPHTRFLAYTKKYALINEYVRPQYFNDGVCRIDGIPHNMIIRYSKWDGYNMENPYRMPVAYVALKRGNVDAIPETARKCPHYIAENWNCIDCAKAFCGCYGGCDVVLPEH